LFQFTADYLMAFNGSLAIQNYVCLMGSGIGINDVASL